LAYIFREIAVEPVLDGTGCTGLALPAVALVVSSEPVAKYREMIVQSAFVVSEEANPNSSQALERGYRSCHGRSPHLPNATKDRA
jgi:hypothetical protein